MAVLSIVISLKQDPVLTYKGLGRQFLNKNLFATNKLCLKTSDCRHWGKVHATVHIRTFF